MAVMEIQATIMAMQYANGTGLPVQLGIVLGKGLACPERSRREGRPTAFEHQIVDDALVLPSQRAQFSRQGEGQ